MALNWEKGWGDGQQKSLLCPQVSYCVLCRAESKEEEDDEDLEGMDAIDSFVNKLNANDVDDGK